MSGFAVLKGYRFEVLPLVKMTQQMVFFTDHGRERRRSIGDLVLVLPTEDAARRLADQLTSANAEKVRRERSAREWFNDRVAELVAKARGEVA